MSSSSNDLSRSFQRSEIASALFADTRLKRLNVSDVPSTKTTGRTSSDMAQATSRKAFQEHLSDASRRDYAGERASARAHAKQAQNVAEQRSSQPRDQRVQKNERQTVEAPKNNEAFSKREVFAQKDAASDATSVERNSYHEDSCDCDNAVQQTTQKRETAPTVEEKSDDTVIAQAEDAALVVSDNIATTSLVALQLQTHEVVAAHFPGVKTEKENEDSLDTVALNVAVNPSEQPITQQLVAAPQMVANPIVGSIIKEGLDGADASKVGTSPHISGQQSVLTLALKETLKTPDLSPIEPSGEPLNQELDDKNLSLLGNKTVQSSDANGALALSLEKHISNDQKVEKLDQALNALSKSFSPDNSTRDSQTSDHTLKPMHETGALQRLAPSMHAAEKAVHEPSTTLNQVPLEIGLRALSGSKRFDIRLDPPELGRIEVKLDLSKNGEVNAQLIVDRVETLTLLQRDARTLERAFEQIGLKAGEGGINLSLRDPSGDGQKNNSQHERDSHERVHNRNAETTLSPEISSPMKRYVWRSPTGVDMHV